MDAETLIKEVCDWTRNRREEEGSEGVEITPDTDLLGSGILDSLSFIDLIAFIEESVGVELDLMELDPDAFSRVEGLCEFALAARS